MRWSGTSDDLLRMAGDACRRPRTWYSFWLFLALPLLCSELLIARSTSPSRLGATSPLSARYDPVPTEQTRIMFWSLNEASQKKGTGIHIITLFFTLKKSYYESNAGTNATGFEVYDSHPGRNSYLWPPYFFGEVYHQNKHQMRKMSNTPRLSLIPLTFIGGLLRLCCFAVFYTVGLGSSNKNPVPYSPSSLSCRSVGSRPT